MTQEPHKTGPVAPPRCGWRVFFQIVTALALLAAGFGAGSYWTTYEVEQTQAYNRQHPEQMPDRMAGKVAKQVGLSSDQEAKVRDVFRAHYPAMQAVRQQIYPQMRAQLDQILVEIRPFMDAEQYAKAQEYFATLFKGWQPTSQPASQPEAPSTK